MVAHRAAAAPKPRKPPAVRILERPLQKQITETLTLELAAPGHLSRMGVVWFAVDHANYGGVAPGERVTVGIVAGLPDLWFLYRGACYVIELKAEDGFLSVAQKLRLPLLRLAGVPIAVACTAEQVLRALDTWAIPRERRVIFSLP